MTWQKEYTSKLMTAEELVEHCIPNGTMCFTSGLHVADAIIREVLSRVKDGTLRGIEFIGISVSKDLGYGDIDVPEDVFRYHCMFSMWHERPGLGKCVSHVPVHFGDIEAAIAHYAPEVGILQVSLPDEDGFVNVGPLGIARAGLPYCRRLVGEVNRYMPCASGDRGKVHVNCFDAFIENHEPLYAVPDIQPTSEEERAAAFVAEHINDGDTIQVGIGGMGTAVCRSLVGKKHLGCYSEMYSVELARLQQKGIIDNSRKNYCPGVSYAGYSEGSQELYDYVDHNPEVYFLSYSDICDPLQIAKNDNMISVNSAISIDLTGQVCAESLGPRQYTASGGQMNFVLGAKFSKGGKSFICMTSVADTRNGPVSKIAVTLAPGSAVTTLRNDVHYVATEYGCVNLRYCDVPTRVRKLISIAHPCFREQLEYDARKIGFLY